MKPKTWKYKFPSLGHVRDVEGSLWDVRDIRTTKHGFDLLFGSPVIDGVSHISGLPQLIATQELVEFWEANRTNVPGPRYDLPAGRTTLKRARQRLGFHFPDDLSDFWQERLNDLGTLSVAEFAVRHGLQKEMVFAARHKLLGRRARLLGWWQKPRHLKVLQSEISLKQMSKKLKISTSHAKRLRDRVRQQASLKKPATGEILDHPLVESWAVPEARG